MVARPAQRVEFAEPNRHVATDNHWTPASLDDDHLHPGCVARRRDEPQPGEQFELAVDRDVLHAGCIDPLANRVVVLAARVSKFEALNVGRFASEEMVATTIRPRPRNQPRKTRPAASPRSAGYSNRSECWPVRSKMRSSSSSL